MPRLLISLFLMSYNLYAFNCESSFEMNEFHSSPQEYLAERVTTFNADCSPRSIDRQIGLKTRRAQREQLLNRSECVNDFGGKQNCLEMLQQRELSQRLGVKSAMNAKYESPEMLLGTDKYEKNILKMSQNEGMQSEVETTPWSDSYWPIYSGQIALRYADPGLEEAMPWDLDTEGFFPFIREYHEERISATPADLDLLSPAEKYDLLVGDMNYTMTKSQWEYGQLFQDRYGEVATWMGICDGWAAASMMMNRPEKTVSYELDNGQMLNFRPSDLKALGSLLWAKGQSQSVFMGRRCEDEDPETDDFGRIQSPECFDINPGAWHQVIVNRIKNYSRPLIIDATYSSEVWNHPVLSYEYKFINLQVKNDGEESVMSEDFMSSVIAVEDFENDIFKQYRSPQTKYIVGVVMELVLLTETEPSTRDDDSAIYDDTFYKHFVYDLELDSEYNIIGGEWYEQVHPDFLWAPLEGGQANSMVDFFLMLSNLSNDQPARNLQELLANKQFQEMVPYASQKQQPVGTVVRYLFEQAKN